MVSRKQKAAYLAAGAGATAAVLWLGYSKSGAGARSFLAAKGAKAGNALGSLRRGMAVVQQRLEETDRLAHDLIQLGSKQKDRIEIVLNDTWGRFGETRDLVLSNMEISSREITGLLGDIRSAVREAASAKRIRVA